MFGHWYGLLLDGIDSVVGTALEWAGYLFFLLLLVVLSPVILILNRIDPAN